MNIFSLFKQPTYSLIALGSAFVLFDIQYYFMKYLPGTRDFMCIMGANFTPINILFSAILSICMGILISGLFFLIQQKNTQNKVTVTSLSGIGAIIGSFTIFCTVCTLPVISLFGISLSLQLFVDYNLPFKIMSLFCTLFGIYLLNKQIQNQCTLCKSS